MGHPATASDGVPAPVPFRTDERITGRQVTAITGLTPKRIREAVAAGHLTAFRPPAGVRALVTYSKRSAEALAASMVTVATSNLRPPTEAAPDARA